MLLIELQSDSTKPSTDLESVFYCNISTSITTPSKPEMCSSINKVSVFSEIYRDTFCHRRRGHPAPPTPRDPPHV